MFSYIFLLNRNISENYLNGKNLNGLNYNELKDGELNGVLLVLLAEDLVLLDDY
jgi:hypothetical protein